MAALKPFPPFAAVSRCRRALGKDAIFILNELRAGKSAAFESRDGISIIRNERPELVIVAYEGKHGVEAFKMWLAIAGHYGFETVRFHSSRPGMAKYAKGVADAVELIFRRNTDGRT